MSSYIPAEMYEENVFESNSTNENNEPVIEKNKNRRNSKYYQSN